MNKVLSVVLWATAAMTVATPSSMFPRETSTNTAADEYQTEPRRAVVRPGESVTLLGNAGTPLVKCHFYMPGGRFLDFSEGADSGSSDRYEYFGRGLDNGECGIRIKTADGEDDGVVESKVRPASSGQWERCVTALRVTNVPVSDLPVFDIEPRSVTLARGTAVTITCNADRQINLCHFYLPGPRLLNLDRGRESASTDEYRYHGTSLRDGQCGVTLTGLDPGLTGYVVCKVGQWPEQLTGAWETDVLKITTRDEEKNHRAEATRRPSQSPGSRPTTPPTDEYYSNRAESTRRPSQSPGSRPTTTTDEYYNHRTESTRRPSQSLGGRPTTTTENVFTRFSGTTRRPSQSHGNRPTTPSSEEVSAHKPRPSQPHSNRPTPLTGGGSDSDEEDDEECGRVRLRPAALVTSGHGTEQGQWPWHVAVYQNKGKDLSYICGGSLISRRVVLTAAHCVTKRPTERLVNPETLVLYFGKYRRLVWTEGGVQSKQIDQIHVHPSYNGTNLRGDIALVTLKSPVDYTNYVRHVCLWDQTKTELREVVGKAGTVVGWGRDESGEAPPELMVARMPVVDHQTCIWSYQEFFSEFTSNKTLCAGFRNGTSVCNGDSGGGLVFPTKQRGDNATEWHLRALVSLSVPRGATRVCDPNHYVVFTDVAKYLSWISSYMR